MDPNHVKQFCGNMFSLTGKQIDALRQILAGGVQNANSTTTSVTEDSQWGQYLAVLLVILTLLYSLRQQNRRPTSGSLEKASGPQFHQRRDDDSDDGAPT